MKVAKSLTFNERQPMDEQIRILDINMKKLFEFTKGRVRFGSGNDGEKGENISGEFQVVADTGGADTKFSITHTLGAIPIGFLVTNISVGGVVYDDGTAWTDTEIHLKCSVANAAVTVFLLK